MLAKRERGREQRTFRPTHGLLLMSYAAMNLMLAARRVQTPKVLDWRGVTEGWSGQRGARSEAQGKGDALHVSVWSPCRRQ